MDLNRQASLHLPNTAKKNEGFHQQQQQQLQVKPYQEQQRCIPAPGSLPVQASQTRAGTTGVASLLPVGTMALEAGAGFNHGALFIYGGL